jgi:hypothetical protein
MKIEHENDEAMKIRKERRMEVGGRAVFLYIIIIKLILLKIRFNKSDECKILNLRMIARH